MYAIVPILYYYESSSSSNQQEFAKTSNAREGKKNDILFVSITVLLTSDNHALRKMCIVIAVSKLYLCFRTWNTLGNWFGQFLRPINTAAAPSIKLSTSAITVSDRHYHNLEVIHCTIDIDIILFSKAKKKNSTRTFHSSGLY